ncbi:hypothetical protein GSU68_04670 [Rathayibacter sp. VKM Ac-2759]|nr:hypothetical protein GSU68_04670 [Rathayibacter sp. VKM Ac-2759]
MAEAEAAAVSGKRLRASDLESPFSGVRAPRGAASSVVDRARALATVLPEAAVFSHLTAARIWPLPLPAEAAGEPVHVAVRHPERAPRRRGVTGHALRDPEIRAVRRHGLRATDGASLFCHLALSLRFEDLVAVGDALVQVPVHGDGSDPRPWVSIDILRRRVEHYSGPGCRAARRALAAVRVGAESRRETLLRLVLLGAGLPEPELNIEVVDEEGVIGRVDLLFRDWAVVAEYEGDHHRTDREQWDRDILRYERLVAAGYAVVRIADASFSRDPAGCAARVRSRLHAAGWRPAS